ncbi:MAG: hypothetical protein RLZZ241_2297 [Bacteroidota bacterium]|jgi:hypothetical protein
MNDFKKYSIEFTLLFLAVTLGFFAENYREYLVERDLEKRYLIALQEDLVQDTVKINYSLWSKETKNRYFDTLNIILKQAPKPWPTRKLYFIARFLSIREPFYGTEGTQRQLENSGGFRLIQNHALINRINEYSAAKEKIYKIQEMRDFYNIPYKEAVGNVFEPAALALLFDSKKHQGSLYYMKEMDWDPPLLGSDKEVNSFFFWASNDIFVERNLAALLEQLKTESSQLIQEIRNELNRLNS